MKVDRRGALLKEPESVRERLMEYIEELCDRNWKPTGKEMEMGWKMNKTWIRTGPQILRQEVEEAIREMKNGKAVGVDGIPAEF